MRRILASSALALAAAVLAACSDSGSTGTCNPGPNLAKPVMLYPIPGAVGVPDSPQYIVVANVGPGSGSIYLQAASGGTQIAAQALGAVPSPGPSPAATTPPGATALAAAIPTLGAATTYNVSFTANPPTACVQTQSSGVLGSFSTQ
jgi:hypothetical protein